MHSQYLVVVLKSIGMMTYKTQENAQDLLAEAVSGETNKRVTTGVKNEYICGLSDPTQTSWTVCLCSSLGCGLG